MLKLHDNRKVYVYTHTVLSNNRTDRITNYYTPPLHIVILASLCHYVSVTMSLLFVCRLSFCSACPGGVHVSVYIIVSISMCASLFACACLPCIFCEWYKVCVYTYVITVKQSSDLDHISPVKTAVRKCVCDLIQIDAYPLMHFFTFFVFTPVSLTRVIILLNSMLQGHTFQHV